MKKDYILIIIFAAIISAWPISLASVDYSQAVNDGMLPNSGHIWGTYSKQCEDKFDFEFNFNNLTGGIQADLNVKGSNRYAIGFINLENGSLATYLFRQDEAQIKQFPGKAINYTPSETYHVEAIFDEGDIRAFINGVQDANATTFIDYLDDNPLPLGEIDLETLGNSSVQFSDPVINCEKPGKEKTPNLGVGYFKPPP
jgi:hypothetical protein